MNEWVIDFSRYSLYSKLLGATTQVFRAIAKFRGKNSDQCKTETYNYLVKTMQEQSYPVELEFLRNTKGSRPVPNLVSSLNVFITRRGCCVQEAE